MSMDNTRTGLSLDKVRGSMVGGAIGDALGFPVEFITAGMLRGSFGEEGITAYVPDRATGKALISDDTQMTMFTAAGICAWAYACDSPARMPHHYVAMAYQDWLTTQTTAFSPKRRAASTGGSWLLALPALYSQRAPGNTCLSALQESRGKPVREDYRENPPNKSKGCGGIMRVAPLGLCSLGYDMRELDREGANLAALTHGHSLGYMPAAVLTHLLHRIVYAQEGKCSLKAWIREAEETVSELFSQDDYLPALRHCIAAAIELSENGASDADNIRQLGQGWVAEETLAIALYCTLRHETDFSAGIIAAVNHDGDSDSTGAVTGNILGAIHGYSAIDEKWIAQLELHRELLELSDDLCRCGAAGGVFDPAWEQKYGRAYSA